MTLSRTQELLFLAFEWATLVNGRQGFEDLIAYTEITRDELKDIDVDDWDGEED